MAKPGDVQLSPARQIKQEQWEYDASGSASDEIEPANVGDSTPPTSQRLIQEDGMNSNAKRGLFDTLSSIFRRGSAPSPTKAQKAPEKVEDPEEAEGEQTPSEPDLPEIGAQPPTTATPTTATPPNPQTDIIYPELLGQSKEPAIPLKAPGNLVSRKGVARSKDPYDLDSSPEIEEKRKADETAVPSKPVKRQRPNGKAKELLAPPKGSKGKTNPSKLRVPRELPHTSGLGYKKEVELESPRVFVSPVLESSRRILDAVTAMENPNNHNEVSTSQVLPSLPMAGKRLVQIEGGDSGLYMDPSPAKNPHKFRTTQLSSSNSNHRSERAREKMPAVNDESLNKPPDYEDEIEEKGETEDLEGETIEHRDLSGQRSQPYSSLINVPKLTELYIISCRVGKSAKNKTWTIVVREKEIRTSEARRLDRRLDRLYKYSNSLAIAKEERNRDKVCGLEAEISSTINRIKTEVQNLILNRLPPLVEDYSIEPKLNVKSVLRDVYFHTIPYFTKCVMRYAEIYVIEGSMETSALREFTDLIDMFYRLLLHTTKLPNPYQPRPRSGEGNYQIYQPGKSIFPEITKLWKTLQAEVSKRNRAERAAEVERMRPQLERAQAEREHLEKRVRKRKLKERHRLQSAAFQKHLEDPLLGDLIFDQIIKESEKVAPGQVPPQLARYVEKTRLQRSQPSTDVNDDDDDDDDPFSSDYEVQIKVNGSFGKNNNRGNNRTQELTTAQKDAFINTLRYNHGPDRYELAARKTQLSMDEVFYLAKELQEVADRRHERGEWNSEGDGWTYDIWVEQR